MDRKAANKHLNRLGLTLQTVNAYGRMMYKASPEMLRISGSWGIAYRLSSNFSPKCNIVWVSHTIKNNMELKDALCEAALNHPRKGDK